MTTENLLMDILLHISNKPKEWRLGQFVFNYIDEKYNVARAVQYSDKVDCFYDDKNIYNFLKHAAKRIE